MKKTISIILSAVMLLSVFAVMPLTADAYYERTEKRANDDFEYLYDIESKEIGIYQYIGKSSKAVVPAEIDGCPVTTVTVNAFEGCDYVTDITLPDTLRLVGEEAFNDTAYYKDEKNWENGVLYIGSVLVEAGEDIEGAYTVKKGTTAIAHYAFVGCEKLTKITIPGTVKYIPESMFTGCKSLESATLEEGVEDIDENVFKKCSKLSDIKLPKSLNRVGMDAFKGTAFYNNDYNWENGALYYDNILITVDSECDGVFTVKDGTTVLGDYAFMECNVEKIIFPNGIKTLPYALTGNCLWLKTIELGDDLEEVGSYSISDVQNVTLPDSVKKIDYRAFFQSKITEIKLPENLKVIDVEAFLSCSYLKEITIPKGVEKIGHEALGYRMSGLGPEGYITTRYESLTIKGYPGTVAEAYAKEHDFDFVDLTKEPETEPVKPDEPEPVVTKKSNPLSVTAKTASVKAKKLRSKKQTLMPVTVKNAQGKVIYKLVKKGSTAKIFKLAKINSKGVITLSKWKKAKKGDYKLKISITAKGNGNYKKKTVNKVLKVKIK